jgi:glycosyltransferase involved in cell wall biosynthesis
MKIAQIAPLYESVPPRFYGGTERIVAYLSDALVELGHDVTLFASADSGTKAKLVPVRDRALRLDPAPLKSDFASHLAELHAVRELADEFDVLHFHIDLLHFPFFEDIADRTITTLHGRLDIKDLDRAYEHWRKFPLISISESHRKPLAGANWLGTVHHGLPMNLHKPPERPRGDYLAFLGRISPEKGPERAIEIATRAGMPLKIAAKVDNADKEYFCEVIKPLLDNPLVEFIGEITDADKAEFLGNAQAVLFPIAWPEPFGLVMIEAMAAATPVIATAFGSVREIIEENVTGAIVGSVDEAVAAVARVAAFDRAPIRRAFEKRFSAEAMARKYLTLYRRGIVEANAVTRPAAAIATPLAAPLLTQLPHTIS